MSRRRRLVRALRALLHRDAVDRELDDEIRLHLALETEDIARETGVSPAEARRRALLGFGGVARYREEHRDARGLVWLESAVRDLRHAGRGLVRSPGFTFAAVGVLAFGIGATTAVFSAVNAVLRDPAHDGLAVIFFRGFPSLSTVDFRAIETEQRSFTAVGAMRRGEAAFRARGEAERVRVGRVTTGFFDALGVRAAAGRLIESGDGDVGAAPVAVLSHALAERAFGGARSAIGEGVMVDGVPHTVVGVLSPTREMFASRADVWPALQLAEPTRRGPFGMLVIARLAADATYESATRDVAGISERVFQRWTPGWSDRTARYEAVPIRTAALAASSRMLRIFAVAVALVLLIGIANVASLMLVRAIGRSQEVSMRAMLGASRAQLVRLFLAESALLSVAGAVAGLALGALGLRALVALGPSLPGLTTAGLDARAALFAAAVAVTAGLVVAAYPVALLFRKRAIALAGDRTIGGGRGTRAVRSTFVIAQFALALPLLAMSALLLVSFVRMQRVDAGFDPANLLTVRVSLPSGQYGNDTLVAAYWTRALARVGAVPGTAELGLVSSLPPDDFGTSNDNFNLIDRPAAAGVPEPNGPWPSADADYFAALRVPLLDGRLFTVDDDGEQPVVVVSRSWAQRYYPGESVIGRTMVRGGCTECTPTMIIGVVGDVRYSGLAGPLDALYSPVTEQWPRTLHLFIRTHAPPAQLTAAVREALRSVDAAVPLDDIASMEDRLYANVAQPRQWAALLGLFAAAALGLAAIGVFGMLSYLVGTRRREIGVRLALGAAPHTVVRMIVGNGVVHAAIGSLLGLAASLAGTSALTAVLYDVDARDPRTLVLATLVLLAVAVVACWLPARRAGAIDPLMAIRHD